MTQEMTNKGLDDHKDRANEEGDDLGETDGEPTRLQEPWQKKMITEGLIPRTAKIDARELDGWNPLAIFTFL